MAMLPSRTIRSVVISLLALSFVLPSSADARRRRSRKGTLAIESMTDGAKVYVDGKMIGKTPFAKPIRIDPGTHKLKATKFGYSTMEMEFTIKSRRQSDMIVDLIPHSGLVKFTCNIESAEVYVDNKLMGHSPLVKTVPLGDHEIMIIKEGYNDFAAQLNVKAGEKHFVEGVLTPFNYSPEVLAIKKKEEDRAKKLAAAELEQPEPGQLSPTGPSEVEPVPAWYNGLHKQWWVWTIVGAVVTAAVAIPVAATSGGGQPVLNDHDSPIDPDRLP